MEVRFNLRNDNIVQVFYVLTTSNRIETVYTVDRFDPIKSFFSSFSSRYTFFTKSTKFTSRFFELMQKINEKEILDTYSKFSTVRKHSILSKYVLFRYSEDYGIPLYRLPIQKIYYVNEYRNEIELSVHAFINSTYRLSPRFSS